MINADLSGYGVLVVAAGALVLGSGEPVTEGEPVGVTVGVSDGDGVASASSR